MSMCFHETLVTAQVAGSALTAAAAASALPAQAKYPLPGQFFSYIGKGLVIEASGKISNVVTTPGTARFDVRLGGTVVFDTQAMLLDPVAHTNESWYLKIFLTAQVVGSAAQLIGGGFWASNNLKGIGTMPLGTLVAPFPWSGNVAALGNTFDATALQTVDLFFTQTVATGSLTLMNYHLYSV